MSKLAGIEKVIAGRSAPFLIALLLCGLARICLAQENKVDLDALMEDTQKRSTETRGMTVVQWIPVDYWRISYAQDPTVSKAQAEECIKIFRAYTLVAVVNGEVGPLGGVTYKSEKDIRAGIQMMDSQRNLYSPLGAHQIDADMKNYLSMMKPYYANMLGPYGQNMHFFLFPAKNKKAQSIADAKKEGAFSIIVTGKEFRWKLPLSSLLPPKTCPTCREKLSGAYKYCPWDGTRL